jgi:hypothetical protein
MVDLPTSVYRWGWVLWIVWFVVLETLAVLDPKTGDTLTEHTRPLFHHHPLLWFLAAGFVGWIAVHFLFPSVEKWLTEISAPWRFRP